MKNPWVIEALIAAGLLAFTGSSALAQTTVFNDQFTSGDTVQTASPGSPTATSTAYEYFQSGAAPTTPTGYTSGSMVLSGFAASSALSEVEAQFTTTPIELMTVGDYIDFSVVFVDAKSISPSGTPSTLNVGMYSSGGSPPAEGAQLNASGEGTGGALGWVGYVGRISGGSGTPEVLTRPVQGAGPDNTNVEQDVLFNDASSSSSYDNPKGAAVGAAGPAFPSGLTQGDTYTVQLRFTLSAAGTLTISNALYSGSGETGTPLYSQEDTTTTTLVTTNFDSLAFGWRFDTTAAANGVDINQILVQDDIQSVGVPPPPKIVGISLSGTTLTFSATNGVANGMYVLLESTNPALALTNWTPVFTNTFDGNGDINLSTNIVNPANLGEFYLLQEP